MLTPPVVSRDLSRTCVIAIIPRSLFLIASVDPRNWAIIGGSTSRLFFTRYLPNPVG